jgi:hypothetical protein
MSAGSVIGSKVNGIPYNVAADANVSLIDRLEKEGVPHSGGVMIKRTIVSNQAEAIKYILRPSEYDFLRGQVSETGDKDLSYQMADGSNITTTGEVTLGPYQTEDSSCEVTFLTTTGEWDIFAAS